MLCFAPSRPVAWNEIRDVQPRDVHSGPLSDPFALLGTVIPKPRHRLPNYSSYFEDYVLRLPLWERELLHPVQYDHTSAATLTDQLQLPCTIILAGDGASHRNAMTFGAVLGTTQQHMLKVQGHGYGLPSAHRAEAWAILAVSRLLLHVQQFYRITLDPTTKIVILSDSSGLISRLTARTRYKQGTFSYRHTITGLGSP